MKKQEEISLKELILLAKEWILYFKSQWAVIIIIIGLGGGLGIVYAIFSKPSYTSTLSFVIEDDKQSNGLSGALGLASQFGFDLGGNSGGGAFSGGNLLELMKSRTVLEMTLLMPVTLNNARTTLADAYIDQKKWRNNWRENMQLVNMGRYLDADPLKFSLQQDSVLNEIEKSILKSNLSIGPRDKKLNIIDVKFVSGDQFYAKTFVEIIVNVVSDFYTKTKTYKTAKNVAILQHQADSIRGQLNGALSNVAGSMDATYNLNPAILRSRTPVQRSQIDVQANSAILTEIVKNLELAKIALRKETPLIQVIDSPKLPLEMEKFGKRKGLTYGSLIAAFLIFPFLLIKRLWKKIMQE
jgi:hypothetical protein